MSEFKYPATLTPAHWAKNKGLMAKSKPTGIGEALSKLVKAHEALDTTLFDADRLATADAAQKALDHYEKTAKKDFVRAFEEAKTVEDTASSAATMLKKAALVPKSAVEAAAAVAKAASDFAVELTSWRQTGVKALERRLEALLEAAADEDDENAPAEVIAGKLARKVVDALKLVKTQADDPGKRPQLFVIAAAKSACALFVGPRAGNGQKSLLKKVLSGEGGTPKFFTGECIWESESHTFVGEDIPLGGFAKRLQKSLLEATGKKYKLRVRRTSGEVDEAGEEDDQIPLPPGDEPPKPGTGATTTPSSTTSNTTAPQTPSQAEQLLTQRLKLLLPRLQPELLKGGDTANALKLIMDKLRQQLTAKDFNGASLLLDRLEQKAQDFGAKAGTATREATHDKAQQMRELLIDKLREALLEAERVAQLLAGTATYKAGFLLRCQEVDRTLVGWVNSPPPDLSKRLKGMHRRVMLLNRQVSVAAIEGPRAQRQLQAQRDALVLARANVGDLGVAPGLALVPAIDEIERRFTEAQGLIDRGEFTKSKVAVDSAASSIAGLTPAMNNYARDNPAFQVQRNLALQAIENLKRHPQAPAIQAEIERIEAELKRIDGVVTAGNGWSKATTAVGLIVSHCDTATELADQLQTQSSRLPELKRRLTEGGADTATTARLGAYAHKLLVEERCTDEQALEMARDTDDFVEAGLNERDARVSARVCRSLVDAGIPRDKALVVGKVLRASGTAEGEDAKAVALLMARMSVAALENLAENNVLTECFRGGVTEVMPDCVGVVPRGWESLGLTWDNVPGMYSNGQRKVFIGTMADAGTGTGTDRKVPAKDEVAGTCNGRNISHGTDDLVGHESGHAFDVSDGDMKSENDLFRQARLDDLRAGNLVKDRVRLAHPVPSTEQPADTTAGMFVTRDNYFVMRSEPGVTETDPRAGSQASLNAACSETFAESFAMHFAGTADRWPALKAFWQTNPWGI